MNKSIFIFLWVIMVIACEEIINEENISNTTVTALAPTHNSMLNSYGEINYNWQGVGGASYYELQVATPNFSQAAQMQLDTIITHTTFSIDSLKIGDYEWRVKALNSAFETLYTTNGFTVVEEGS